MYRILLLTIVSLVNASFPVISQEREDYLTPDMYGAKGDGKNDDTEALRQALLESSVQGKILFFPSNKQYLITGTLNYYRGQYNDIRLNMLGCIPIKKGSYIPEEFGGLIVLRGVKLFHKANISGSIERMCITGQRDLNVHFFDTCDCKELVISKCNISNFGALFYDTPLHGVSQIIQNTFLTLYYFARNEKTSSGMTDSSISFNYINGGMEQNDNSCFEWAYFNGDIISNNFIDYYRTIYNPKAIAKQAFVGPLSYSNQYQVFRYLYYPGDMIDTVNFYSSSDSFNWNDPTTDEKIQGFIPETYKGKDGILYDIPPCIAICNSSWIVYISDAKIERNMSSLIFINSSLTEYEYNRFEISVSGNNQYKTGQIIYREGDLNPFYNSGKFRGNAMKVSGIVEIMNQLPQFGIGWTSSVPGRIVKVGEKVYKSVNRKVKDSWQAEWIEIL